MYSKDFFSQVKFAVINKDVPEDLCVLMEHIDNILFKDQMNDWRNKPKPNFLNKNLENNDELNKQDLNSFLNKLSGSNFEQLFPKINETLEKTELWDYFIELLFSKSIIQPIFCPVYVKLLKLLEPTCVNLIEMLETKITNYVNVLSDNQIKDNNELTYDEFCQNNKLKIIKGGYSQFIGELYINELCKYKQILDNISLFITNIKKNDENIEDNIICLDKLVRTIKDTMNIHDKKAAKRNLETCIKLNGLSKRLMFKLMDLVDII
jgi:hypothetical protein